MDEVDRRIVNELQINARRSNKELAEVCGVSPSTVLHRLRSLQARGVIRGYHAEVAAGALGRHVEALVSVRLQPKTPAAVAEFMDAIWALDETVAASMVTGAYDVLVHVSVRDVAALSETVLTAVANAPHVAD